MNTLSQEEFISLTDAEKRVVLAKDILQYIDLKFLRPIVGHYFHPVDLNIHFLKYDIREVVKTSNCYTCAIGALFIASIMHEPQDTSEYKTGYVESKKMKHKLTHYFTLEQLALIECAFERSSLFAVSTQSDYEIDCAISFGDSFRDSPNAMMAAIMINIISNKGEFNPHQEAKLQLD